MSKNWLAEPATTFLPFSVPAVPAVPSLTASTWLLHTPPARARVLFVTAVPIWNTLMIRSLIEASSS